MIFEMNAFPVPFKTVATVLLTTILVAIGVMNLRDRASWIDPTDGVFWVDAKAGVRAEDVDANGPAAAAGVRKGDILRSVNGIAVPHLGRYFGLIDALGPNASVTYGIETGSEQKSVTVSLAGRSLISSRDALRTLLAFLYLGIGLFVAFRSQPRAFHFYLICVAAFVAFLYSWTPRLGAFDGLVYALSVTAFLLLPALFLHFCMRFPVELSSGRTRAPLVYVPALAIGLVELLWMTGRLAGMGLPRTAESLTTFDRVQLIHFCVFFAGAGILLLVRRARASDLTTRQQMKWISYGTLAGVLPFTVIYAVPWLCGVRPNFAMESSMLFLGVIPLSFAYAIIRYRLLDVEVIVRRGVAYFAASSLLLSAYLFLVLVIGRGLQLAAPDANFVVICAGALAIALLFAPLRNRIQSRLDRFFYKDQFDDRASLVEFARTLSSEISLGRLSRLILERVSKTFQVKKVALFLSDSGHPGSLRLMDSIGVEVPPSEPYREEDVLDHTTRRDAQLAEQGNRLKRLNPLLAGTGLEYAQELKLRGRRIGVIALGQLPRDRHLSSEDVDLLTALSGYAAIALENANLYRSVETKALELERLKIYTENIIESINVAVVALDLNGKINSCNRAFEELYGVRRDQVRGKQIESLLPRDVLQSIHSATGKRDWDLKASANIFKLYVENRRAEKLIVNVSVIPLLDSTDLNSGCLIVMDDITAKVRLEDQLLQAEKLSSIGLLAAGIAHEVNTPITGISSYTQMLLKQTPESDLRKPILEKIEKQTFRAAEIVNGLLNFARMNGSEFKDLDLNQLIQESVTLLDHQLHQGHVNVQLVLDNKIPSVYGNGGKLQQVFINLFLNARDAMPRGGDLRVCTAMNESMVIVDIQDSGVGISEDNIRRIYDPVFTTKSTGTGTGLGLAVTYGIVQEHGGRIFVDSTPGQGTHFRLKLPTRHAPQR